jgi:hypothetical protein
VQRGKKGSADACGMASASTFAVSAASFLIRTADLQIEMPLRNLVQECKAAMVRPTEQYASPVNIAKLHAANQTTEIER